MKEKQLLAGKQLCLLCVSAVLEIELGTFALTLNSAPILSKHLFWQSFTNVKPAWTHTFPRLA